MPLLKPVRASRIRERVRCTSAMHRQSPQYIGKLTQRNKKHGYKHNAYAKVLRKRVMLQNTKQFSRLPTEVSPTAGPIRKHYQIQEVPRVNDHCGVITLKDLEMLKKEEMLKW